MKSEDDIQYKQNVELRYDGELIETIPLGDNKYEVVRIMSTSLDMYLNNDIQPGSVINI